MAVSNLYCRREGDSLRISWAWTPDRSTASITLLRALDGAVLATQQVSRAAYDQAIASPQGSLACKAPAEPVIVRLEDEDGSCEYELLSPKYVVEWRFVNKNIFSRGGLFSRPQLQRVERYMQLRYPCEVPAPQGMFYYTLSGRGAGQKEGFRGVLPGMHKGINTYGLLLAPGGRTLQLHCDLQQDEKKARLFQFRQLPDLEE